MIEFFLVFFNIICYIIDINSYIFVTEDNTMDIKTLQYFIAVVESTSITKAAKVLHISQPPLSQQIKQLEAELGTQLLERGPRCVTLTDAGETLYHRAKNIVSFTEDTCREIRSIGSGTSGADLILRSGTAVGYTVGVLHRVSRSPVRYLREEYIRADRFPGEQSHRAGFRQVSFQQRYLRDDASD